MLERGELVDQILNVDSVIRGNIAVFWPGETQSMNLRRELIIFVNSSS